MVDPVAAWLAPAGARSSFGQLGETEVEDLDAAVDGDEDVLWLQVTMDDALLVRGGQAMRDLNGVLDRLASGQRAGIETLTQRGAFEQLRDDVGRALMLTDIVDRQNVRMIQRRRRARLSLEPLEVVRDRPGSPTGSTLIATSRPRRES